MIVFLGLLYSPEDETRIFDSVKGSFQSAANNFQWGILKGIKQETTESIVVVNSVPMGTYPKHSKIMIEKNSICDIVGINLINCGYINLPIIKQFNRKHNAFKELKRIILNSDEPVTVVTYSLYLPYLKAILKLKRKNDSFKDVLIIPDLPGEFGIMSANHIKRFLERVNARIIYNSLNHADGYIFLTEQMKEAIHVGNKKFTVVEGVYTDNRLRFDDSQEGFHDKSILYTGTLDRALGVETLVDAFEKLPKGLARLKIAGSGNYESDLRKRCNKNPDIHYLGFISKDEVQHLQNEATVLVNPRSAKEEYTKYSFPSKTMEYLASGKPVVMNKLQGIPKEYYEHIYFTETDDVDGLSSKLLEVLQADSAELQKKGEKARRFILQEKSGAAQAKKILDLINSL